MSIRTQTPPNRIGIPNVGFNKQAFDATLWNKGYDVIHYDAIECPCKQSGSTNITSCQNCLGLGWVFINPIQTKAILTSLNTNTQFKYWSPEFKGTVAATLMDVDRLSFMDKLVLKSETSVLSEIRPVQDTAGQKFLFTSYPVNSINSIFLFNGETSPLTRLQSTDYSISADNPYVIKLSAGITYPANFNNVVSIDYYHNVQYNVVDLPHNIRSSMKIDKNGKMEDIKLPVQAICQLSHYVNGDSPKYDGTGIQDNSYK